MLLYIIKKHYKESTIRNFFHLIGKKLCHLDTKILTFLSFSVNLVRNEMLNYALTPSGPICVEGNEKIYKQEAFSEL